MITVTVDTSSPYNVIIGQNILTHIDQFLIDVHAPCKVVIISDNHVYPLYADAVASVLKTSGYCTIHYTFDAGENNKSAETYMNIVRFLAQNQITRSDLLIALGGGVVGDMTGFVAATFLRGISYVQVPTSLLAMVDSSVGGKTAIDLPEGKNLVGTFYQPKLVLCDISLLNTLPEHYFLDGCAEVIKYAVLFDSELFEHLRQNTLAFDKEYVIAKCIDMKRKIVAMDERDLGDRQLLNLGHTFGHSIEKLSNYTISHGFAVAAGICMAAAAAYDMHLCTKNTYEAIVCLIRDFQLLKDYQYDAISLADTALNDKKRFGKTINMIFPCKIGQCCIEKIPVDQLHNVFKAGLTPWISKSIPKN